MGINIDITAVSTNPDYVYGQENGYNVIIPLDALVGGRVGDNTKTLGGGGGVITVVNGQSGPVVTLAAADVGLGAVDNTSDINKPLSSAAISALLLKQDALNSGVNIKTINGITLLGAGDITIAAGGAVSSVNGQAGVVILTKADIGLTNIDNTSDVDKPVSLATATALASKQPTLTSGLTLKTINGIDLLGAGDVTIAAGGGANLSMTVSPANIQVNSDTGTDIVLPLVDATNAGLMSPAQKTLLDGAQPLLVSTTNIKTINGVSILGSGDLTVSGSGSGANLSMLVSPNDIQVNSDTGTDIVLPLATTVNAGLMSPADKTAVGTIAGKQDALTSGITLKTINGNSLLGGGDITIAGGGGGATNLSMNVTATGIDVNSDSGSDITLPLVTAATAGLMSPAQHTALAGKQDQLTSGTTIKTINGQTLLGSGDIVIAGGGGNTNLSMTQSATSIAINSDTGTDISLPLADGSNAGLLSPGEKNSISTIASKQDALVSGGNVKTINGNSIVGGGNLVIDCVVTTTTEAASRNLTAADDGRILKCAGAITLTIPAGLGEMRVIVHPPAAGNVTIAVSGGATINSAGVSLNRSQASNPAGFAIMSLLASNAYGVSGS